MQIGFQAEDQTKRPVSVLENLMVYNYPQAAILLQQLALPSVLWKAPFLRAPVTVYFHHPSLFSDQPQEAGVVLTSYK